MFTGIRCLACDITMLTYETARRPDDAIARRELKRRRLHRPCGSAAARNGRAAAPAVAPPVRRRVRRAAILRQRDAGADADLEHPAADPVGGRNRRPAALAEYAAEYEVVDRCPAVIGLLDHFAVEVEFDDFCHGSLLVSFVRWIPD